LRRRRCRYCRRPVALDADLWAYKDAEGGVYCSYGCLEASRHALADRDRKKEFAVIRRFTDSDLLDRLKVDIDESHSLEDWAEMFGLDYYDLWESTQLCRYCIIDAVVACMR
jgi:hypothetical protein